MSKKKIQEEEGVVKADPTTDQEVSSQDQELEKLIQEEEAGKIVIDSEEKALSFYKQANYKAPEGINFCFVTSDQNVFWPENGSSANNHAFKNGLKIFRIEI